MQVHAQFARQFKLDIFLVLRRLSQHLLSKAPFVNTTLRSALRTAALALSMAAMPAFAQNVIKIGEINSYKAQPAFLDPYKKGMELAVEEINAKGGVNGKQLQLITRDDNASPGDAVRAAEELLSREKVDVLSGAFLSHIGLALGDFAKQRKVFFLAGEPLTATPTACAQAPTCKWPCSCPKPPSSRKNVGPWCTPTTNTANRLRPPSSNC
jgi:hypothetical protein